MSFVIFFSEADLRHAEVGRGRELPSPLATVWVGNDQALPTPQQDAWKLSQVQSRSAASFSTLPMAMVLPETQR